MPIHLSAGAFAELVRRALEDIPGPLVEYMQDVTVDVAFMPGPRDCEAAGVDDPRSLLGLYQGTPLTHRSVEHSGRLPDRITIYKRNIERGCRSREEVIRQIQKTVFHEVGHHFGLDEEELSELGYQ